MKSRREVMKEVLLLEKKIVIYALSFDLRKIRKVRFRKSSNFTCRQGEHDCIMKLVMMQFRDILLNINPSEIIL